MYFESGREGGNVMQVSATSDEKDSSAELGDGNLMCAKAVRLSLKLFLGIRSALNTRVS